MSKRIGRARRKTRSKLRKNIRTKGKISLTRYFQRFNLGDKAQLLAEPAVQKAIYFPRFHGKYGTITGKRGACYQVEIKDGKRLKMLIVHPVHLKKCQT